VREREDFVIDTERLAEGDKAGRSDSGSYEEEPSGG
jgi:hypothetical protein